MTWRHGVSEAFAVIGGALVASAILFAEFSGGWSILVCAAFLLGMVGWICWQDLSDLTIPDGPLIAIAIVGAASRMVQSGPSLADQTLSVGLDMILCGGALLLLREAYFRLRDVEGLGFGDVKLGVAGGALIGTVSFAWAVFVSSLAGLLVIFVLSMLKPKAHFDRIAFGAFLAPACWGIWISNLLM